MTNLPRWIGAVAGITAVAMTAIVPIGASAYPAADGGASSNTDRAVPASRTFTLITGDVVGLVSGPDGKPAGRVIREAGKPGSVAFVNAEDHIFALPSSVLPLLTAGQLDRRLFDLNTLQEAKYDDATTPSLPLIAAAAPAHSLSAPTPVATTRTRAMDSIGAEALSLDKAKAAEFWRTTVGDGMSLSAAGYTKLWLDGAVQASLDTSVPAVGAPAAWQHGLDGKDVTVAVLDTGIDAKHPDFAGRIKQSVSFVQGQSPMDGNGHGTHTSSILAGSGAGSNGKYRGVAPGAQLLVGKVLSNSGWGRDSDVIAGMEWAAAQKARVVSMSLGGAVTDGTDPLSQTVNRLSETTGTLFVIAAGNNARKMSVGAPAAADRALAVGNVDHRKGWAPGPYTSQGPRYGDYGIKPEITAPGTNITAAAANSGGGYRTLTGTSMAAPHVAGAAAILAQQHPDWPAQRLYDSLVSSAKQVSGGSPSTYGGGVLDVAAATTRSVTAPAKLSLGTYRPPSLPAAGTGKLSLRNDSAAPVTLNLSVDPIVERVVRGAAQSGVTVPDGSATVTPASVTIPAGGTVTAEVRVGLAGLIEGSYYGRVVGRDAAGAEAAHTVLTWTKGPEVRKLDVRGYDVDGGAPDRRWSYVYAAGETGGYIGVFNGNAVTFYSLVDGSGRDGLPAGRYTVGGYFGASDHDVFVEAQPVVLDQDRHLDLDARQANRIQVNTPRQSVNYSSAIRWSFSSFNRGVWSETFMWPGFEGYRLPADSAGTNYAFKMTTRRVAPPVKAWMEDSDVLLWPVLARASRGPWGPADSTPFAPPSGRFTVVDAGDGTSGSLAGKDLKGKVALVREAPGTDPSQREIDKQVAVVTAAGATGMVFAVSKGERIRYANPLTSKIWVTVVAEGEGRQLADAIANGSTTLATESSVPTPYLYDLDFNGPMPAAGYQVTEEDVATVVNRFHAPQPGTVVYDYAVLDGEFWREIGTLQPVRMVAPFTRTDYLGKDHLRASLTDVQAPSGGSEWISVIDPLPGGAEITVDRLSSIVAPGPFRGRTMLTANKYGAGFTAAYPPEWPGCGDDCGWDNYPTPISSGTHDGLVASYTARSRAYDGDKLLCDLPKFNACGIASSGKRRLVMDTSQNSHPFSTRTTTEWTVNVQLPTTGTTVPPVLIAQPTPPVDATDRVAERKHEVPVRVGYQPGADYKSTLRVSAWVTFDDGATWAQTMDSQQADPGDEVDVPVVVPSKHNGFVGLRMRAVDEQGNAVDQTIIRAYGLTQDNHNAG